jgi:hypothetical protein
MTAASRRQILALLAGALAAPPAPARPRGDWAQGYTRQAQQVLARGRAACGGGGWNYLRGWHEVGTDGGVRYELWLDPLRYGLRREQRGAAGLLVEGFNGLGAWRISPSGTASGAGDGPLVTEARTEAFFGVSAYFWPGRFDAAGRDLGVRTAGGRSFAVVEVKPWGGSARELWFDARSGLLARMVQRRPDAPPLAFEVSDYRKIGPVRIPFRILMDGEAGGRRERRVESLSFTPADRALFSLPRGALSPAAPAPAASPSPAPPPAGGR